MITGSILNKLVSEADDKWGKPWDEISKLMRVYAIANVKHGRIVLDVLVGCIFRNIFPEPKAVLYPTGATQGKFVAEFNTLLVEALVGMEIQTEPLLSAWSREDVAKCIRYRTTTGAVSISPPSRVEVLIRLFSPWLSISYGGCRYLRHA